MNALIMLKMQVNIMQIKGRMKHLRILSGKVHEGLQQVSCWGIKSLPSPCGWAFGALQWLPT